MDIHIYGKPSYKAYCKTVALACNGLRGSGITFVGLTEFVAKRDNRLCF